MTELELVSLMTKAAPAVVAGDRLEELAGTERAALVVVLEAELGRPILPWRPTRYDREHRRWDLRCPV